jgi:hypothetical protein
MIMHIGQLLNNNPDMERSVYKSRARSFLFWLDHGVEKPPITRNLAMGDFLW